MKLHSYSNEEGNNIIVTDSLIQPNDVEAPTFDLRKTERELHKLLEKDMKLKWDIVSLSDSWREARIPRGLRIHKYPAIITDAPFKEKWESILNKCSMDLILLLIEDGKKQRIELKTKIDAIEATLPMPPDEQATFQQKIHAEVHKLETTIKEMKLDKYKRDSDDYEFGKVYRWTQPRTPQSSRSGGGGHHHQQQHQRERSTPRRVSFNLAASSEDERGSNVSADDNDRFLDHDWPPPQQASQAANHNNSGSVNRGHAEAGGGHAQPQRAPQSNTLLRNQPRKFYPR